MNALVDLLIRHAGRRLHSIRTRGCTVTRAGFTMAEKVAFKDRELSEKLWIASGAGALAGGVYGAIHASWTDVPAVVKGQVAPAVFSSARVVAQYSVAFAATAAVFAGVDHAAAAMRGKRDFWNAALGGCAAGSLMGIKANRLATAFGGCAAGAAVMGFAELASTWDMNPGSKQHRANLSGVSSQPAAQEQ